MGSDENRFPTEPERDGVGNWHILGSLVAAPKPRLKKLLHQLAPVRDACANAIPGMRTATRVLHLRQMLQG